ncbi:unnamed protein product [Mytilus edulis]|uniref:COR domain-containing protein n=1 Tax=Mytilus edulis TaxID=6550 RepID=A0A8S3V3T4_MYTED|nr:unnamed protein product [Mytilus edulis]
MKEESYPHFESRLMLAGEQGTGKTTIARYLVGRRPTRFRMSTDGIELYNGLSYMDLESKEWICGEQVYITINFRVFLEDITVCRSLSKEDKMTKSVKLDDTTQTNRDVPFEPQTISIPGGKGNRRHESDNSLTSDIISEGLEQDDIPAYTSSLCEDTMNMIKRGIKLEVETSKSQDVLAIAQDISLQPSEECLSHESNERLTSGSTLGGPQLEPDITMSEHQFTRLQDTIPLSEKQHSSLFTDRKFSDGSRNRNELVQQDVLSGIENTDSSNDRDRGEAFLDIEKPVDDLEDYFAKLDFSGEIHIETVTKPGLIKMLKNKFGVSKNVKAVKISITEENLLQMSSKVGKKKLHNKKIAPIIIWDFGGQDVFYSTHQTFLTYRAIYMIVLDGSRKLDDPCPYEQYLPGKSKHKTARDYLLFWINTIVTYCKGCYWGFPKIMVVLTHKDLVKAHEVEERRHEIFAEINKMFQKTPLMHNLVIEDNIFVNAKYKNDPEMGMIKKIIMSESERQPTWGELLPKCFIPLELEFASLIRRNIPLITLEHLRKINSSQPIRPLSEDELKVFLKFQHSIGKLLYFEELKLDDRIILSPTLLIDAFKSIVTDKRFCKGDRKREEIWDALGTKGVVSKVAIQEVWKRKKYEKFYKDMDYLLNVMTHLDILVELKRYDSNRNRISADFYYVASMVRGNDDSGYLHSAGIEKRNIALAFQSSSLMIPPALSFRFISFCLSVWAVKTYGEANIDMLFHRSAVFTIDPSLDMYILCEDDKITVRLIHARTNALIMRDLASSINECLTSALEKISQLYIRTSSGQSHTSDASFVTSVCCGSPDKPCILPFNSLAHVSKIWNCPSHGIEHNIHTIKSWIPGKDEDRCEPGCPVTNENFLKERPSDLHLRRLSLVYNRNETQELALQLGLTSADFDNLSRIEDSETWKFEVVKKCRDRFALTFRNIIDASEAGKFGNIHRLCKLVKGDSIDYDIEPEKWDLVPTEEHIDRLAPLIGNNSLQFLIKLEMELKTWEQIMYRHTIERDLVKLNKDILEEWKIKFCKMHSLKPTLRKIAQAFSNIGKHIQIVENTLSDLL